jgi:hypothetical protein
VNNRHNLHIIIYGSKQWSSCPTAPETRRNQTGYFRFRIYLQSEFVLFRRKGLSSRAISPVLFRLVSSCPYALHRPGGFRAYTIGTDCTWEYGI